MVLTTGSSFRFRAPIRNADLPMNWYASQGAPMRVRGNGVTAGAREWRQLPIRVFVAVGLVVTVLSIAWGFAGIEGELRLRDHGLAFNEADLALDTAAASRSHLGEALRVAAFGEAIPAADGSRVEEVALTLAEEELWDFKTRVEVVLEREPDPSLAAASDAYVAGGTVFIAALRADDIGAADAIFATSVDPAHSVLTSSLAEIRAARLASFAGNEGVNFALGLATRLLLAVAVPIGAIFAIFDAMRRRQRQRELELQLDSERDVGKAKDEFIANVSHELRTPLTIVHGFAAVLEEEEGLPEHVDDAIAYIARESGELNRMVDDLLTAARADAGALAISMEQFPIDRALEAVVATMNHGEHRISVSAESAYAYGDAFRMRQIIRNLLSNARKHGGPDIVVSGVVEGDEYVLTVSDNGPGVDPEIENRIFDRFVHGTGRRLLAGSVGLGLAIAKSLSDRMNVELTYQRVGFETQFRLRIPLAPAGSEVRAADAQRPRTVEPI